MNRLLAVILSALIGHPQVMQQGIATSRPPAAAGPSACGSAITSVTGDYWAGSYSASPITTNWPDSSTYGSVMGPHNSPTWANNTFGTGLAGVTMNGSNQYFNSALQYPATTFTNFSGYTVIKMGAAGGAFTGNSFNNNTIVWKVNSTGVFIDKQNLVAMCNATHTFTNGTVYELAVTYDGTTCTFYVNGSSIGTGTNSQSNFTGMDQMLAQGTGQNNYFDGSIYEIMFSTSATYQSGAHTCWTALGLP